MIRRLYRLLPGPPALRVVTLVILALVALTALVFLYEEAGDLLDTGGTIQP